MFDDQELLRRYRADRSEAAFAELVARYTNLVYSVALRRTGGNTELSKDVAQQVFTDLARKACSFRPGIVLAGWLHQATRYAAGNLIRAENRRRAYEQKAFPMNAPQSDPRPIGNRSDHCSRTLLTGWGAPTATLCCSGSSKPAPWRKSVERSVHVRRHENGIGCLFLLDLQPIEPCGFNCGNRERDERVPVGVEDVRADVLPV